MSMYDKNHYNTVKVISLQLIKINEKKKKNKTEFHIHAYMYLLFSWVSAAAR